VFKETGGFGAFVEVSPHGKYCTHAGEGGSDLIAAGVDYPCCTTGYGCDFRGRGAIQLTWNINYGRFSEFYFGDKEVLLRNPELVQGDGEIGWAASLWFWITQQDYGGECPPKQLDWRMPLGHQSCHEAMTQPAGGGLGQTIRIINGGYEACPTSGYRLSAVKRAEYYLTICSVLSVPSHQDCALDEEGCALLISGYQYFDISSGLQGNPLMGAPQDDGACARCKAIECFKRDETRWMGSSSFERISWTCDPVRSSVCVC
jgi:hypothetical protein